MEASGLTYPNRYARALFVALEATAGPSSLQSALQIAGLDGRFGIERPPDDMQPGLDFAEISAFALALENLYGARGGRGIALRTGIEFFQHGIEGVGVLKGIETQQFANLPTEAQVQISLMGLAAVFTSTTGQASRIADTGESFQFIANPSPFAWERVSDKPVCHMLTGTIQACLRTATRGHQFAVYEKTCRATGAEECVFHISKQPIGRV